MFYNVIFSASNALQCPTERIEFYHTAMVNSKKDQGAALPVPKKKGTYIQGQDMVDETTMPVIKKKQPLLPMAEEVMVSSQGKGKPKFPVSRSARAGLQFPVGRWVSLRCRHIEPLSCHCFRDLITVIINRPQA